MPLSHIGKGLEQVSLQFCALLIEQQSPRKKKRRICDMRTSPFIREYSRDNKTILDELQTKFEFSLSFKEI